MRNPSAWLKGHERHDIDCRPGEYNGCVESCPTLAEERYSQLDEWEGVAGEVAQFHAAVPGLQRGSDYDDKHLRRLLERAIRHGELRGRSDTLVTLRSVVKHTHENALGLARFDIDEARCREWGTMLLEQVEDLLHMDDARAKDDVWFERARNLIAKVESLADRSKASEEE